LRKKTCLGPITRAGCDAICPTYGDSCEGCRGLIPEPNIDSLKDVLKEHGLSVEETMAKMTMFLTYQVMAKETAGDGRS
jgi:coenzyme F420-reducing hydrogenase gamma subunit